MTSPKLPKHGTLYRYQGPNNGSWEPCRCTKCISFHSRACKARWVERVSGNPPSAPTGPVAAHIKTLLATGMSYSLIASRAGVARNTVSRIDLGEAKFLHRGSAQRILSVRPGDFDNTAIRPATGTIRRVQALYAIGHGARSISDASGIPQGTVSCIANGHWATVGGTMATTIQQAYQQLAHTPGTGAKAKHRAQKLGWLGPTWWDDDELDDPDFTPAATPTPRYLALAEDVLELERQGYTRQQIADRLGSTRDAMQRALGLYRDRFAAA